MTKVYWNGDREVEDVEGIYEAIKIMDINVNYGRMTPLSQSAFEDNGASKEGASEVNMQARDRHFATLRRLEKINFSYVFDHKHFILI